MARESLKSIESQIRKLQARAQNMRERDRRPVIAEILRQMKAHDISPADIEAAMGRKRGGRRAAAAGGAPTPRKASGPVAPKFRNLETGATWSGRGRTPRWLVDAEAAGKDRSAFAIAPAA